MGKGTILSHTGDGLYSVTLNLDRAHVTAELAALPVTITALAILITKKQAEITALEAEIAALDPFSDEYKTKNDQLIRKQKEESFLVLKKASCEKRKKYLEDNVPVDPDVSAWCADKSTGLSGEVGIIEVPGERKTIVNIQPGYDGNAIYDDARDGQLQPSIAGLENNVFYNWAMLPGWQKWMPTYRYGTITAIDGDTCDITLEAATSSAIGANGDCMNINAVDEITGVPIDYMDVNGAAFAVDDVVLIKFDSVKADVKNAGNWANATVIGFKDHPKYPAGAVMYVQVYDESYNIAGYVGLDKDLNVIEELKTSITVSDPEIVGAITRTNGNTGTSYWSKLWLAGNLIKEYAWVYTTPNYTGTRDALRDAKGAWSSSSVNCYFREDIEYKGTGDLALKKTYVVIDGVEHLLYTYDTETTLGYFSNDQGYMLLSTGEWDWQEGIGAFTVDEVLKYIGGRHMASYGQEGHYTQIQEIFYFDGTTLVHKAFPSYDVVAGYQPFCSFGGSDYYIQDQGPVMTLAK